MLAEARAQYRLGVEPLAMMSGLLSEVHRLTLTKIGAPHDAGLDQTARDTIEEYGEKLSFPLLHRLWQLLLKGHDEVSRAAMALEASDMALLRVIHGASLPDPGELARLLEQGASVAIGQDSPQKAAPSATIMQAAANIMPADFPALLDILGTQNYVNLESTMRDVMRVVEYAPPRLIYQLSGPVSPGFESELREALLKVTSERWELERRDTGEAAPTLLETERTQLEAERNLIMESPLVKAAFAAFPEAELLDSDIEDIKRSASA
jgi:DNA polymerase III subunit gamma/tau